MKVVALVLGIVGGIGAFIGAIIVLAIGGLGNAFHAEGAGEIIGLGWAAVPFALIGIIGGALAISKPKVAGILMLVSAVGGFIAISAGYLFGGPLLIVGGIISLVAKQKS